MANILDLKKFSQKNGEFKITGIFTNKTSGEKFRKAAFCYPGKKPLLVSFGKSIKDSFDLLQDIKKVEKWIYDNLSNIKVAERMVNTSFAWANSPRIPLGSPLTLASKINGTSSAKTLKPKQLRKHRMNLHSDTLQQKAIQGGNPLYFFFTGK